MRPRCPPGRTVLPAIRAATPFDEPIGVRQYPRRKRYSGWRRLTECLLCDLDRAPITPHKHSGSQPLRANRRHSGQSLGERPGPDAFYESRVIRPKHQPSTGRSAGWRLHAPVGWLRMNDDPVSIMNTACSPDSSGRKTLSHCVNRCRNISRSCLPVENADSHGSHAMPGRAHEEPTAIGKESLYHCVRVTVVDRCSRIRIAKAH